MNSTNNNYNSYIDYPNNGYTAYPMPVRPTTPMMPVPGTTRPIYPIAPPPGTIRLPADTMVPPGMGFQEGPPTTTDIGYTPAYLKTQIGRKVKIEFLLGTSMLVDREGTLVSVGINYVIIQETETDDLLLCDLYSIKFVKFYY